MTKPDCRQCARRAIGDETMCLGCRRYYADLDDRWLPNTEVIRADLLQKMTISKVGKP